MLKSAPRERLLAFYQKWYRPDNMAVVVVGDIPVAEAEALVQKHFAGIPAAKGAAATVDTSVPAHKDTLINMSTDPEAQGWSISVGFKGKAEHDLTVGGYRKTLVENLVSQMLNMRLRDIARRPNAPFLGAQAGTSSIGRELELFEIEAVVPEGKITEGLGALMTEAKRMQQYGFSNDELNRAKAGLLAGYERAYKERETSESSSYANEYVRHFLEQEPIPGMEFEYKIAATYLPTVTAEEVAALAKEFITEENRVVLGVAPEKKDMPPPAPDTLRSAITRAGTAPVERWAEATSGRELVEKPPAAGKVASKRAVPEIGATVLTLSNGVEVWLKPTDFKNDQIVFSAYAPGGVSLANEQDYKSASLATAMVGVGGIGGLNPVDLSKMLSGKIAQASPSISDYTQGVSGSATPKDLETALTAQLPRAHRAEHDAGGARTIEAPPRPVAAEPRSESARGVRRTRRKNQHLRPLQRRAADDGRCAEPQSRDHALVLQRAILERRRLHVFLRRRLHRSRDHPAAREVGRLAALDRQEDLRRARHGREVPDRGGERRCEEGQGTGQPDAAVVLRRPGRR